MKWKDWKLHLIWEPEVNDGPIKLASPYLFNLIRDPKEETDIHTANSWISSYMRRMLLDCTRSLQYYPPVPPSAGSVHALNATVRSRISLEWAEHNNYPVS